MQNGNEHHETKDLGPDARSHGVSLSGWEGGGCAGSCGDGAGSAPSGTWDQFQSRNWAAWRTAESESECPLHTDHCKVTWRTQKEVRLGPAWGTVALGSRKLKAAQEPKKEQPGREGGAFRRGSAVVPCEGLTGGISGPEATRSASPHVATGTTSERLCSWGLRAQHGSLRLMTPDRPAPLNCFPLPGCPGAPHRGRPGVLVGAELTTAEGTRCGARAPGRQCWALPAQPLPAAACPAPPRCSVPTPPTSTGGPLPAARGAARGPLTCCTSWAGRSPPGRAAWRCW